MENQPWLFRQSKCSRHHEVLGRGCADMLWKQNWDSRWPRTLLVAVAHPRVLASTELLYNCGFCKPELKSPFPKAASSTHPTLWPNPSVKIWGLGVEVKLKALKRRTQAISAICPPQMPLTVCYPALTTHTIQRCSERALNLASRFLFLILDL